MKNKWSVIKKYLPWLTLLLAMDLFFCLLLWIADVQALYILSMIIILSSLILFGILLFILIHHEANYQEALRNYIDSPTEQNEELLIGLISHCDKEILPLIGQALREKEFENKQLLTRIKDYEEYVEAWAHETKTPISLLTILLDNHIEEIPANVSIKIDYIRNKMQEYVDQMLFYARLKTEKKDYYLEKIILSEIWEDILEDYQHLLEEKHFLIRTDFLATTIFSDKRDLRFILGQIISNSIKYTQIGKQPELEIRYETQDNIGVLIIKDNGVGVKSCDLPYIFEKGFTGDSGENRKKATGMGLYLVKEIAHNLMLKIDVKTQWMQGFEMRIIFTK